MYMFSNCSYEETWGNDGKHYYTFTGPCVMTGQTHSVTVKGSQLYAYNQGAKIQDAFPNLSPGD